MRLPGRERNEEEEESRSVRRHREKTGAAVWKTDNAIE